MLKHEKIYDFQVWEALKEGKGVFMIDYSEAKIISLNDYCVKALVNIMETATDNDNFSFYILKEV